jgi:hypothetical protein
MHFTDFVVHAGVEKNTLGGGGFAGVNVGRNTDVAVALNGGIASHENPWLIVIIRSRHLHNRRCGRLRLADPS